MHSTCIKKMLEYLKVGYDYILVYIYVGCVYPMRMSVVAQICALWTTNIYCFKLLVDGSSTMGHHSCVVVLMCTHSSNCCILSLCFGPFILICHNCTLITCVEKGFVWEVNECLNQLCKNALHTQHAFALLGLCLHVPV